MAKLFGIEKLVEDVLAVTEAELRSSWDEPMDRFGIVSPIEKLFFVGFLHRVIFSPTTKGLVFDFHRSKPWPGEIKDETFYFFTQCVVFDRWPIDFVIALKVGGEEVKIAVECDGHDFHERTKEQAARDRARDRELQRLGFKIFRFTGAELYRDPLACIEEVSEEMQTIAGPFARRST